MDCSSHSASVAFWFKVCLGFNVILLANGHYKYFVKKSLFFSLSEELFFHFAIIILKSNYYLSFFLYSIRQGWLTLVLKSHSPAYFPRRRGYSVAQPTFLKWMDGCSWPRLFHWFMCERSLILLTSCWLTNHNRTFGLILRKETEKLIMK